MREEHAVEIHQHIRHAHLCMMRGETHFAPATGPEKFNKIVEKFISAPFKKI